MVLINQSTNKMGKGLKYGFFKQLFFDIISLTLAYNMLPLCYNSISSRDSILIIIIQCTFYDAIYVILDWIIRYFIDYFIFGNSDAFEYKYKRAIKYNFLTFLYFIPYVYFNILQNVDFSYVLPK